MFNALNAPRFGSLIISTPLRGKPGEFKDYSVSFYSKFKPGKVIYNNKTFSESHPGVVALEKQFEELNAAFQQEIAPHKVFYHPQSRLSVPVDPEDNALLQSNNAVIAQRGRIMDSHCQKIQAALTAPLKQLVQSLELPEDEKAPTVAVVEQPGYVYVNISDLSQVNPASICYQS